MAPSTPFSVCKEFCAGSGSNAGYEKEVAKLTEDLDVVKNTLDEHGKTLTSHDNKLTEHESAIAQLESDKVSAIVCDAQGTGIILADSANTNFKGLNIYGATKQPANSNNHFYLGASINRELNGMKINGVKNESTLILSGTSTGASTLFNTFTLQAGTYTVSVEGLTVHTTSADRLWLRAKDTATNLAYAVQPNKPETFTIYETTIVEARFGFQADSTYSNQTIKIMINEGKTAKTYEDFAGFAYDFKSKGGQDFSVATFGTNFLNVDEIVKISNGNLTTSKDGYAITCKGATSTTYIFTEEEIKLLRGKKFRLEVDKAFQPNGEDTSGITMYGNCSGGVLYCNLFEKGSFPYANVNFPQDLEELTLSVHSDNAECTFEGLRLTLSDDNWTSVPWEKYKAVKTINFENRMLAGVPVLSGGNYTDEDGVQWICDEYDFSKGEYIQRISLDKGINVDLLTTPYIITMGGSDFVAYVLQEPIITPLTETEISQFSELMSYKPSTTALNSTNAHMKVEYVADTKTYIDNKFSEIEKAVLSLGGSM